MHYVYCMSLTPSSRNLVCEKEGVVCNCHKDVKLGTGHPGFIALL